MEDAAIIYNPDNTDEYWQLYINHTFLREQAKQTVVDMTIHDTLFYQMATAEKITLSEEEEQYLANDQQDFWSDLTEEQRARLGVDEETIDASMQKNGAGAEISEYSCGDGTGRLRGLFHRRHGIRKTSGTAYL